MKYLITGRDGQLAQAFIRTFEKRSLDFEAPDESRLDITDESRVNEVIGSLRPGIVINCAAYNLVDRAEQECGKAFAVNADGPGHLAHAAAKYNAFLVHFGTDYVFDGEKEDGLYTENDAVNPLSGYGKSKLAGEKLVREADERSLILRLSWVYGAGTQNFIYKLTEWSKKSEYLKISCDEFSVPTYTDMVVEITLKALEKGVTGLYHLTNSGYCSRYEWAKAILSSLRINKFIRPVSMDTFHLPAKRPKFSAMSNKKLSSLLDVTIPSWEESLGSFLRERAFLS